MSEKRKAGGAMSPSSDSRSAKRMRMQNGEPDHETAEGTTEQGLVFLQSLKSSNDKTGRSIVSEFLTLPSPKQVPQYYEEIRLPIALDTIEEKLNRREYATISDLEGDVKRMVANAKYFNDKRSLVYEDAERIRKTTSNWMTRYNPAYRNPNYVAQPTPIPGGLDNGRAGAEVAVAAGAATPTPAPQSAPSVRLTLTNKAKSGTPAPAPPSAAVGKEGTDYAGLTFAQAQDKIIADMLRHTDVEGGLEIFTPFANLPSRQLKDYYEVIKKPVSLKSVQKLANGIHGRAPPTGVTTFKSWDAFSEEVSFIWRNAREYNEDGTAMFNLANEFQELFEERLAEARAAVDEPHPPTLKLKMSAPANPIKIKLNTGLAKESPANKAARATPEDRATPSTEQKRRTSTSGPVQKPSAESGPKNPSVSSRSSSVAGAQPTAQPITQPATQQTSATTESSTVVPPPPSTNGVKVEGQTGAAATAPPASTTLRTVSASPHPQSQAPQQTPLQTANQVLAQQMINPTNGFSRYRPPGKGAKDALISKLTLQTHPQLNITPSVRINVGAHERLTSQSVTVSLPPSHHILQIIPHLPIALTGKPYRIFVSVNGRPALRLGTETDRTKPVFEGRLERSGVSKIEVEVLAAKDFTSSSKSGSGGTASPDAGKEAEGVQWERSTVFVHLPKV